MIDALENGFETKLDESGQITSLWLYFSLFQLVGNVTCELSWNKLKLYSCPIVIGPETIGINGQHWARDRFFWYFRMWFYWRTPNQLFWVLKNPPLWIKGKSLANFPLVESLMGLFCLERDVVKDQLIKKSFCYPIVFCCGYFCHNANTEISIW